jgi:anti-sigma factor RsiW
MNCKRCNENLTAYLDGELGSEDSVQMQSHVNHCASCSDELRGLQRAAELVASGARELELHPGAWNRVRAQISVQKAPSFWNAFLPTHWKAVTATVICLAMLSIGYGWHRQAQQRSLDAYIAKYEKAREAGRSFRRVIANVDSGFVPDHRAADNPFIEAKVSFDLNPFRSEDR